MADIKYSKLFKPLPKFQIDIINNLGIPKENSTIEEIIKREQIYVKNMEKAQNEVKNNEEKFDELLSKITKRLLTNKNRNASDA
jgi:hypothetical protein